MEGIAKEITEMQKLPKQFYEVTGEATASGSIFIELDFMKGIVKEMAGMQKPPQANVQHPNIIKSLEVYDSPPHTLQQIYSGKSRSSPWRLSHSVATLLLQQPSARLAVMSKRSSATSVGTWIQK